MDCIISLTYKERICAIPHIQWGKNFLEEVRNTAHSDEQYKSGLRSLNTNPSDSDYIKPSVNLSVENGDNLHYQGHLCVPKPMIKIILESKYDN